MEVLVYDKNISKNIALVAEAGCINPRYINLTDLPQASEICEEIAEASYFQLRQMHSLASGIIDGQVANAAPGFVPDEWQMYGLKHNEEFSRQDFKQSKPR